MSSRKTQHYKLHLWEPEDTFVRSEFNENTEKTDAALAAKCDAAAFSAHKTAIEEAVASKCDAAAFQAHKQSIEAAVAAKADNAAFQALQQSVAATVPGKCEVATGAYTGDGQAAKHINLGRAPKAVMVWDNRRYHESDWYTPQHGMGVTVGGGAGVAVDATGFTVYHTVEVGNKTLYPDLNYNGVGYIYFAII